MTRDQIIAEIRKPGPVYVGMLVKNDVEHIKAVKSDLIGWLEAQTEDYDGVYCGRADDGTLYLHNS